MNLSGYSKRFGEGPDAGPPGKLIERTRTYLQEAQLKDKFVYFDEPNMVVYVTTVFGVFVVSIDETQRYGGQLTPWQGISGCSLKITTTPASARIVTVTIESLDATLTEAVGEPAAPLLGFFRECLKRSRP
ncbi:MAG: hypothetical protein AB1Z67_05965 [Candidatus Limnocylindrales bacterium]